MDRSLRPTGVSGPSFSQLVCIFVVRYWIGVRNTPREGPESPARRSLRPSGPEYPAFPDDPEYPEPGRNVRHRPESPVT